MNERIKKLGLEAADWLDDQESVNTAHAMQLYQEKFAELIVKECIEICNNTNNAGYLNGVVAGEKIKKHFGVEE
jgi:hypothetical protein